VELVYWERYPNKEAALKREREIKNLPRDGKLTLCNVKK
jgi:predicted GIY-YIG superfamily endonuclease